MQIEGKINITDVLVLISADGEVFFEYTAITLVPNDLNPSFWDPNEKLIVNEALVPDEYLMYGNWPSTEFHVRIVYKPTDKVLYQGVAVLEPSLSD